MNRQPLYLLVGLTGLLSAGQTCSPFSTLAPGNPADEDDALSAQERIDRDLDGFVDTIDPAPRDPGVPADVGSPEAILANSWVIQALAEARRQGLILEPTTEPATFNIAGRYAWEPESARFLLTSDGTDEGEEVAPGGFTLTWAAPGLYRLDESHETEETSLANQGLVHLRGAPEHFTLYVVNRSDCPTGRARYSVSIRDAAIESRSGDMVGYVALNILLATEGRPVCNIPGGDEPGGWQVVVIDRLER